MEMTYAWYRISLSVILFSFGILLRFHKIHGYQCIFSNWNNNQLFRPLLRTSTRKSILLWPHNMFQLSAHDDGDTMANVWRTDMITVHHTALKTRNITNAILFYNLLGFQLVSKFRAGPAKAAWIELGGKNSCRQRIELIEVPNFMLNEEVGVTIKRAPDLMNRRDILGYNHVALDVSKIIKSCPNRYTSLSDWITELNRTSIDSFGKTIRMVLPPRQQLIGQYIFELAFILDADGCLIELLHEKRKLMQAMDSGWEPWDGIGFQRLPKS